MAKAPKVKPPEAPLFVHPNTFHIWTDGSFRPPDNAACSLLIFSERTKHIVAMERYACRGKTINQMELEAINKALDHPGMDHVLIYSDSAYSISCLTVWNKVWAKHNWMSRDGEPVKNKDLIKEILAKMAAKKFVRFVKVAAHTGDKYNSAVDFLAQDLTLKMREDSSLPDGAYPC